MKPVGRRLKLWHLSVLVALSVLLLAAGTRVPSLAVTFVVLGLFLVPLYLVARAYDRFMLRYDQEIRSPRGLFETIFVRMTLMVFLSPLYMVLIPAVLGLIAVVLALVSFVIKSG